MDRLAEIKRLYYGATPATIQRDLIRAVDLLKAMPTEADRERAAVYMDGLSQMRSEWARARKRSGPKRARGGTKTKPGGPRRR
jgi:hypothetical protein